MIWTCSTWWVEFQSYAFLPGYRIRDVVCTMRGSHMHARSICLQEYSRKGSVLPGYQLGFTHSRACDVHIHLHMQLVCYLFRMFNFCRSMRCMCEHVCSCGSCAAMLSVLSVSLRILTLARSEEQTDIACSQNSGIPKQVHLVHHLAYFPACTCLHNARILPCSRTWLACEEHCERKGLYSHRPAG